MNLDRLTSGKDLPNEINVIIEIPSHSDPVNYEVDKDLDEGKWVRVEGWGGVDEAKEEIMASLAMYKEAPVKPNF